MKSNDLNKAGALVVFSGGQDSTTCLAWALDRYEQVETVGFDYGQVHSIEMSVRHTIRDQMAALRPAWRAKLGPDHVHDARSEEHTSELQSLMRISYAVFCLKKKHTHTHTSCHLR